MASLKGFLPQLGQCLRMSPLALYERQRALVRLGVLTGKEGRGPGSGVRLTADTLAALLTSLLITDNLSEVDDRVGVLLNARRLMGQVTKIKTFGSALSAILSSQEDSFWNLQIEVHRHAGAAVIQSFHEHTWQTTFSSDKFIRSLGSLPLISVTAELDSSAISIVRKEFLSVAPDEESHGKALWEGYGADERG
jgi:hypothetical protein